MSEALKTDLYELTMLAAYHRAGHNPLATFELFARRLPTNRGYLVFAGLEQALSFLEEFSFSPEDIDYLRGLPAFAGAAEGFFDMLAGLRFTGDVWAVPEGTAVFAGEPLLRVTAPLWEAQIVETWLLSAIHLQTLVASKAARVVDAARELAVFDFGSRRAHGPEAGLFAARASYIGGCSGTSNCEAGRRFGIPVAGTMAHSYVMSFPSEREAFQNYLALHPGGTTLLVDTYDIVEAAKLAASLGPACKAVRIDSGDLAQLAVKVRKALDDAGRKDVRIILSGNLNEYRIEKLLKARAPVDAFGVGTEMVVSADAPALDLVYKLVETDGRPVAKRSRGKSTVGGRKQVWRTFDKRGRMLRDCVGLDGERLPGEQLLVQVM
ncbi:MAG: nicotinate phosphoribosyltransferase, partial [Deltaproteobacteria bacterium]